MEWKTLKELNAQPGDEVKYKHTASSYTVVSKNYLRFAGEFDKEFYYCAWDTAESWKIVGKATSWGPWTFKPPKGVRSELMNLPGGQAVYREELSPITKEINLYYGATDVKPNTHVIKFNTIDGVPDVSSIKMEAVFKEKTHA